MGDSENRRSGSFYLNNKSNNNNSNDNYYINVWGFPGGSVVKNPPAKEETQVWPLGQEDPLEKEMVTHSGILAWEIPRTEEPVRLLSMGLQKSQSRLSDFVVVQSLSRVWLFMPEGQT